MKKKIISIVCLLLVFLPLLALEEIPLPTMQVEPRTQTPIMSMQSTSTMSGAWSGYKPDVNTTHGVVTAAYDISGGVTLRDLYGPTQEELDERLREIIRHAPPQPTGCECNWVWDDEKDDYVCTGCGHTALEGCTCDPCRCPIGDGWQVMIFMMLLSIGYVVWKRGTLRAPLFL